MNIFKFVLKEDEVDTSGEVQTKPVKSKFSIFLIMKIKIRNFFIRNKQKLLKYIEVLGLSSAILFALMLKFDFSWQLCVASFAIYFLYQEVITDLKLMFSNFRRLR